MRKTNVLKTLMSVFLALMLTFSLMACGEETTPIKKTHDQETHVITGSEDGSTVHHNFVDGQCTMCGETTVFRQEPMLSSPEILLTDQQNQGTIEYFWYRTRAYGVEERNLPGYNEGDELWIYKRAYVYLPYGYDKNDTSKKYNVLYMMHGNKLNEGYWFAQGSYAWEENQSAYTGGYGTENMLDYMLENNLCEDTIFVGMTMYQYYNGEYSGDPDNPNYVGGTAEQGNLYSGYVDPENDLGYRLGIGESKEGTDSVYWKEWLYHLMPYVVENFNTYAASTDDADLKAARDHVGFTGLSRGGGSVNSVLLNCLEYISYFAYESAGTPGETQIANMQAKEEQYPVNYVFISCGSQEGPEAADSQMLTVKNAMHWNEGSDIAGGDQIEFIVVNGTAHNYATWVTNLYNLMLVFFKS